MKHVMIDFETLGNTPDSAVLSLGAVTFTKDEILDEKSWFFDVEIQTSLRLAVSFETVAWWMKQGEEARALFENCLKHGQRPTVVLTEFSNWLSADSKYPKTDWNLLVWSCGSSFDIPIIESLMRRSNITPPWKFWNHRCYRTIKQMYGLEKGIENPGTKHVALDDARFQANRLMEFLRSHPELEK